MSSSHVNTAYPRHEIGYALFEVLLLCEQLARRSDRREALEHWAVFVVSLKRKSWPICCWYFEQLAVISATSLTARETA